MSNLRLQLPFSVVSLCSGTAVVLMVVYVGLIAVVMSYAALTIEFAQSVKDDEATIAVLESQYLASMTTIETSDYHVAGYAKPVAQTFVPATSVTAMR